MILAPHARLHGVRLHRVDLDAQPSPSAVAALSEAEWERARRFVFKRDRLRFVAAHAALREVLGAAAGLPGSVLEFVEGPFGKPALVEPRELAFNLSHSQNVALIAVGGARELGVDIELLRPLPDAEDLAAHYFSPGERAALQALPAGERERAFLTCWTRKEACLKAAGMGLTVDTRRFDVGIEPIPQALTIQGDDGTTCIELSSIDDLHGALGAVARVMDTTGAARAAPAGRVLPTLRETLA